MSLGSVSASMPNFSAMRARFQQSPSERFAADDTDKSGGLSLKEFTAAHEARGAGPANSAGAPSAEEIFSKLDSDGDGEVTLSEMEANKPKRPPAEFSPETFSSLLSAQEESGSNSLSDFLSALSGASGSSDSDVLSQLLEALGETEDA